MLLIHLASGDCMCHIFRIPLSFSVPITNTPRSTSGVMPSPSGKPAKSQLSSSWTPILQATVQVIFFFLIEARLSYQMKVRQILLQ